MLYNVTKVYVLNNQVLYVDEGEISRDSKNFNQIDVITNVSGFGVEIAFKLFNNVFSNGIGMLQQTGTVTVPSGITELQSVAGEQWSVYTMLIDNAVLSAITSTTSQTLEFAVRFSKQITNLLVFDELGDFPTVGQGDRVYQADDTKQFYIWNGTAYVTRTNQQANELIINQGQQYTTEPGFLSIQGTIGGEPVVLDPAWYQNQIVSDLNNLISLYNAINGAITDSATGLAQKANKTGDSITGQFDFSSVDLDQLETPLAALKLGGNNITTSGQINDYTFESGALEKDAIKYANLAQLFNLGSVTPSQGQTFLQAYTAALTAKFSSIQTNEQLAQTFLRRSGVDAMTGNLNMGGQSITNVNLVDGVDVSSIGGTLTTLQNEINALQGAYVLRGTVTQNTEDLIADPAPLTAKIVELLQRQPILGDVLRDSTGGEWYFDGSIFTFVGQAYIDLDDYYTKVASDQRYYTKTQLNVDPLQSNVLDARYYTETELDQGSLDGRYYTETETDNLLAGKVDVGVLSSSIVIYPTDTPSGVSTYVRGVTSINDADYDTTAVNVTTPSVTGIKVPVGSVIADANLFVGNPGVISVPIVGNVRSSANNVEAEFYFEIYKRDSSGTEVLLGESTKTKTVTSQTYEEFNATGLLNNGEFTATDRLVFKFFADKIGSVDGTFDFQYGGSSPVRILLNVPIDVTLQAERLTYDNSGTNIDATNVQDAITELDGQDTTIQNNLNTHVNNATGAHAATAISFDPTGVPLTTNDLQSAIAELFDGQKIDSKFIELQFEDIIQGYYDSNTDAFYEEDTFNTEITLFDSKSIFIDLTSNDLYRYDALSTPKFIRVIEAAGSLGDISDVVVSGAENGEFLKFDGTNWVNASIPTINKLGDIGDVDTTNAITGSVIKYDSTLNDGVGGWVIGVDNAGTTISTLGDVGDIGFSNLSGSQFLRRNAGNTSWENHSLVKADVDLDNVENYPVANNTDIDNDVTNKYMTPSNTKYAINTKFSAGVIEENAQANTSFWTGTQAQYDALATYDANTLYIITG